MGASRTPTGPGIMVEGYRPRQGQGGRCASLGVLTPVSWRSVRPGVLTCAKKVCLLPAAHHFRNLIHHWARDPIFFSSSSSLTDSPTHPVVSSHVYVAAKGSSSVMGVSFSLFCPCCLQDPPPGWLIVRAALNPWLSVSQQ